MCPGNTSPCARSRCHVSSHLRWNFPSQPGFRQWNFLRSTLAGGSGCLRFFPPPRPITAAFLLVPTVFFAGVVLGLRGARGFRVFLAVMRALLLLLLGPGDGSPVRKVRT